MSHVLLSGGKPLDEAHSYELRAEAYLKRVKYWESHKDWPDSKIHIRWYKNMYEFFKKRAKEIRENELSQVS